MEGSLYVEIVKKTKFNGKNEIFFLFILKRQFSLFSPLTLTSGSAERRRFDSEVAPSTVNGFGWRYSL